MKNFTTDFCVDDGHAAQRVVEKYLNKRFN